MPFKPLDARICEQSSLEQLARLPVDPESNDVFKMPAFVRKIEPLKKVTDFFCPLNTNGGHQFMISIWVHRGTRSDNYLLFKCFKYQGAQAIVTSANLTEEAYLHGKIVKACFEEAAGTETGNLQFVVKVEYNPEFSQHLIFIVKKMTRLEE